MARPHSSPALFDPEQRAREKQASRVSDAASIGSGVKTVEQLRRENSFTAPLKRASIDYTKVPVARIR